MEPQQIHAHVVVVAAVTRLLAAPLHEEQDADTVASAATTALQFNAANSGFDVVAFRADFSASSNIRLRVPPPHAHAHGSNDGGGGSGRKLQLECQVFPFERRTLAHVMRESAKRAFVRVRYELQQVCALAIDELELAQRKAAHTLREAVELAHATYYAHRASLPVQLSSAPAGVVQSYCDDINRFFAARDRDVQFVDASFAPASRSLLGAASRADGALYGTGDIDANDVDEDDDARPIDAESAALYSLSTWRHLHDILHDGSWTLAATAASSNAKPHGRLCISSSGALTDLRSPLPNQDSLVCALAFLSLDKVRWLAQLMPSCRCEGEEEAAATIHDLAAISVRLCERGMQWRDVLIDLFVPGFPLGNGLMGIASVRDGELYPMLLQKAYAKLRGSYRAVGSVSTLMVLRELTGLPWVSAYRSQGTRNQANEERISSARRATQSALQRLICRRHRHRRAPTSKSDRGHCFVVSFGSVDAHHCAFPVLSGDTTRGVVLRDVGDAIRTALGRRSPTQALETSSDDTNNVANDDERLTCECAWSDFFALDPHVSMLLVSHSEARRQRLMFVRDRAAQRFEFALSVAGMTSFVVSTQVLARVADSARARAPCRHTLTLDAVGADFSLTRIEIEPMSAHAGATSGATGSEVSDSDLQLVLALGAGEYVLSVIVEADSEQVDVNEGDAPSTLLTEQDAKRNLQLFFDCVDQDMDGAISLAELQAFLHAHEARETVAATTSAEQLAGFLTRFGRADCARNDGTSSSTSDAHLLLDDLRDVYQFLAASSAAPLDAALPPSASSNQRYAELLWSDLRCVLLAHSSRESIGSKHDDAIRMDAICELHCCIHSDMPLVDVVHLRSTSASP